MKKIIPLTPSGISNTFSRWLFLILGISHVIQGIDKLGTQNITPMKIALAIFLIVTGLLFGIPFFFLLNPNSQFAPKCIIDEDEIKIKEDIHKKRKSVQWKNVKEITFKSFAIDFLLTDNSIENILLRTNGETSIEIKKSLRAIAETKSIPIIGG